jgi:subtilase family serine protease
MKSEEVSFIRACRLRTPRLCAVACAGLALAILLAGYGVAQSVNAKGMRIANNTPRFVHQAENIGPEDSSRVIEVTVWVRLNNQNAFHQLVQQLYQKDSPRYHQWLTPAEFNDNFAPKAEAARVVQDFLTAHNLSVVSVGPDNSYVKARGNVSDVQNAFHVQIHKFKVAGKTYRANTSDPVIEGPAGLLVAAVGGMDNLSLPAPCGLAPRSRYQHAFPRYSRRSRLERPILRGTVLPATRG